MVNTHVRGCYLVHFPMFPNSYQLDSHNQTPSALARPRWNVCKNQIENRTGPDLPWFSYGYREYTFVNSLTGYTSPPN